MAVSFLLLALSSLFKGIFYKGHIVYPRLVLDSQGEACLLLLT